MVLGCVWGRVLEGRGAMKKNNQDNWDVADHIVFIIAFIPFAFAIAIGIVIFMQMVMG